MVEQQNIFEATTFSLSLFGQRQLGERCVFEKHQPFYFAELLWGNLFSIKTFGDCLSSTEHTEEMRHAKSPEIGLHSPSMWNGPSKHAILHSCKACLRHSDWHLGIKKPTSHPRGAQVVQTDQ